MASVCHSELKATNQSTPLMCDVNSLSIHKIYSTKIFTEAKPNLHPTKYPTKPFKLLLRESIFELSNALPRDNNTRCYWSEGINSTTECSKQKSFSLHPLASALKFGVTLQQQDYCRTILFLQYYCPAMILLLQRYCTAIILLLV